MGRGSGWVRHEHSLRAAAARICDARWKDKPGQVWQVNATHVDQVRSPLKILGMWLEVPSALHVSSKVQSPMAVDKQSPAARSRQVKSDQSTNGQARSGQVRSGGGKPSQIRSGHP